MGMHRALGIVLKYITVVSFLLIEIEHFHLRMVYAHDYNLFLTIFIVISYFFFVNGNLPMTRYLF